MAAKPPERRLYVEDFDDAVKQLIDLLHHGGGITDGKMKAFMFSGFWGSGLGASAVIRATAEHLKSKRSDPDTELQFGKIVHVDCSLWTNRRTMQRKIAAELDLGYLMPIFDKQDEDDDFRGVHDSYRAEITSIASEIHESLINTKFLLVLHYGGDTDIDLLEFGVPLLPFAKETLVHSTLEPCEDSDFTFPVHFNLRDHTIYVRCRPYLKDFLERVASMFEIIIFTASQSIYAEQLLNVLDPKRRLFRHRVYRESCVYVEGNYLKDLSVLGRDLSRVVIVDNSPQAFGFQLDNGIPIESWFDDPNDKELLALLPFLESLVGVEDVRPFIATKFNLRQKVASATSLAMHFFPNAEQAN